MTHAPTALRVCVVLPSATRGGAEVWQERVAATSRRLELDIVTLAEGAAAQAWRDLGTPVTVLSTGRRAKGAASTIVRLAGHLRRSRPDLVLGHGVKAGAIAALAGHLSGTRPAWMRHDDSFAGRPVQVLDALTDGRIRAVERLLTGHVPETVAVPDSVHDPIGRAQACADLDLPTTKGVRRVVMATRLVPYKGVDDAIRGLTHASGWELHVYGLPDGAHPDEDERLRGLAADLGLTDRVHLHGPVEDIGRRLSAFDAVAVLTRDDPDSYVSGEAYGTSAHEGMRGGVPILSTPPLDRHLGAAALSVPAGDPRGVADALHRLEDQTVHRELSDAALDHEQSAHAGHSTAALERHLAETARRPGAGLSGTTRISVVTTVLNEADGLDTLLTRLREQLGPGDEIVVVDGGSSDGTADVAHRHHDADSRVRLILCPGAGISTGRNIGIADSQHDLVACTDVGCHPQPGWLDAFRAAAADRPDAGLLTGVYTVTSSSPLQRALAVSGYPFVDEVTHPTPLTRLHGRFFGRSFDATMPTGRSVAMTRQAWRDAGGFPEHLATGEDVTFGRAVARTHPATLVSDALVTWEQRPTLRSTLRMYYRYGLGSGHSQDPLLLRRDALRALAYPVGLALLVRGGPLGRTAALAGAAAYLAVPIRRAVDGPDAAAVTMLVPAVAALRDMAKVAGAARGLIDGTPAAPDTTAPLM